MRPHALVPDACRHMFTYMGCASCNWCNEIVATQIDYVDVYNLPHRQAVYTASQKETFATAVAQTFAMAAVLSLIVSCRRILAVFSLLLCRTRAHTPHRRMPHCWKDKVFVSWVLLFTAPRHLKHLSKPNADTAHVDIHELCIAKIHVHED